MRVQPNNSLVAQSGRAKLKRDGVICPAIALSDSLPMRLIRFPGIDNIVTSLTQLNDALKLRRRTRLLIFRHRQTWDKAPASIECEKS